MTQAYETLTLEIDARGVATCTLNRPEKRNAMTDRMLSEFIDMAGRMSADPAVRVVILTGAGDFFCAGGDLSWMKQQIEADRATRMKQARGLADALYVLNTMDKPLIGRINGSAFGGGLGLISVCDVAIAPATAQFGFTETRLGLIPATISPYVIARMGEGKARRVFMSARLFSAEEAVALDLLAKIVPAGELDAAIEAEVAPYLSVAPSAVAASKRLARSLGPRIEPDVIEATIAALADTWETEEARHGIEAFLSKTPPRWAR
jgi:methylglutaconyl-CoA hydratase